MRDHIERSIDLRFSVARVWTALTDPAEFSEWFHVRFVAPFIPGQTAHGTVTYPGYEGLAAELYIVAKDEPTKFIFSWHPYMIDSKRDYSGEPLTVVEFTLMPTEGGTCVSVVETGILALPPDRATEVYEAHGPGWEMQLGSIETHLVQKFAEPA